MNIPKGPHQRAGRRRRRGKAVALIVLIAALAVLSSWTTTCAAPEPGKWDTPSLSDLAYARNIYNLQGGAIGEAQIYLERWPQYAAYITGEVDTPEECEAVG